MVDFDPNLDPSLLDEIGPWSERKFGIVQEYATVYSRIMANAKARVARFEHDYIDGYASAGFSRRKGTNDIVKGTALNSLEIEPPFKRYTFVELSPEKHAMLSAHVMSRSDVSVLNADANEVLPRDVFPQYTFANYRRAFCLLDPYTHKQLDWTTIEAAGKNGAVDLLLHFPTMPMNRGALHRDGEVSLDEAAAMTRFWGDDSWREAVYVKRHGLFADLPAEKATDIEFATAFCERLTNVAGFKGTSKPIPMKNTRGAIMYYLIFALPHDTAIRAAKSVAKYFIEYPSAVYRARKAETCLQDAG
jgi:three-Cys-motif partner protein